MSDTYFSLTVELPESQAEAAEDALHECGAMGLEVRDREVPPMPGVRPPLPGEAIIVAFFSTQDGAAAAREALQGRVAGARLLLEEKAQEDWSNAWKALIRSVQVGRLWVGPPWDVGQAPKDRLCIVIEPKMAFGTGDHPTTSLCLAAVDEFMGQNAGASVLDVGTGTGVLAIAAKKLGAGRVVGTDNDPISVTLAQENAQVNATPDVELSGRALTQVAGTFELVVANILANTLVELAPLIGPKVGKRLVLAGVLAHQKEEVERAYTAQGLVAEDGAREGEWVRLDFHRP